MTNFEKIKSEMTMLDLAETRVKKFTDTVFIALDETKFTYSTYGGAIKAEISYLKSEATNEN